MAKEYHTYRCMNAMPGCSQFVNGEKYPLLVDEPPEPTFTIPSGACQGTTFEIDEEEEDE